MDTFYFEVVEVVGVGDKQEDGLLGDRIQGIEFQVDELVPGESFDGLVCQ